jgi:hypothetical protein
MQKPKLILVTAIAALCVAFSACHHGPVQVANAQVAVDVGVAPDCPYGYYDAPPYDCAPYG